MLEETQSIVNRSLDFLPLKSYSNIVEGNALRIDWKDVIAPEKLNYIMGNPPFAGARFMSKTQKDELQSVYSDENGKPLKNSGNIDYVAGWYFKASMFMSQSNNIIRTAFVSTNSITQGEQVANVWKPLYERFNVHIDFAWRTFKWVSEASEQAAVHVVIVGFSVAENIGKKYLLELDRKNEVKNINFYLSNSPVVFIETRNKSLCDTPQFNMGNQPIDGGNYLFTDEEKEIFLKKEPNAEKYFKRWYGAKEFINNHSRWCLWLGDCPPQELIKMPYCMERVNTVRELRLSSNRAATKKLANIPTRFQTENMPSGNYIVMPEVSSERRKYIPIGYMDDSVLCSNKLRLMSNATYYHFGILTSNVHMEWMRTVAGRLEMRYDYSIKIVYNNFPWCTPTVKQKEKIEKTAQAILDARSKYSKCSFADMYGDNMYLFPELLKAHQANDRAVMEAYGFIKKVDGKATWYSPSECVSALMKMYQELTSKENK